MASMQAIACGGGSWEEAFYPSFPAHPVHHRKPLAGRDPAARPDRVLR